LLDRLGQIEAFLEPRLGLAISCTAYGTLTKSALNSNLFLVLLQGYLLSGVNEVVIGNQVEEPLELNGAGLGHELAGAYDYKLLVNNYFGLQVAEDAAWMDLKSVGFGHGQVSVGAIELPLGDIREESLSQCFQDSLRIVVVI